MIDYVKILLNNIDTDKLIENPLLEFKSEYSVTTGESSNKIVAKYHFCKVVVIQTKINKTVLFTGSIHKMYNSINGIYPPNYNPKQPNKYKGYNGNNLTLTNTIDTLNHIQNLFNCSKKQMKFQNIEIGFNIRTKFNPQVFILGVLYHKNKRFSFRFNDYYTESVHENYRIKIYNKSNQYGLKHHTLRIEVHLKKSKEINKTGIINYDDININTLKNAKELLIKKFKEVIYYDNTIKPNKLNKKQKEKLKLYNSINYWLNTLKPNHRDYPKKKLQEIIDKHSDNLKKCIINEINKNFVIFHSSNK